MQHNDVAPLRLDAIQHGSQMIKRIIIADWNEDITGSRADRLGRQIGARCDIELIQIGSRIASSFRDSFSHRERSKKRGCKYTAGNRGDLFLVEINRSKRLQRMG